MRTRYGTSYWLDRYPKTRQPSYPRHRGEIDVQVAVVGGGLTGASIAYVFAAAGVRVALLEAERIGQGGSYASRRTTALGLKIIIPCAASPPRHFCQEKDKTSTLLQSISIA